MSLSTSSNRKWASRSKIYQPQVGESDAKKRFMAKREDRLIKKLARIQAKINMYEHILKPGEYKTTTLRNLMHQKLLSSRKLEEILSYNNKVK